VKSGVNAVYRGNVTEKLGTIFNGARQRSWRVDVALLGDPAPAHPKDLEVYYTVSSNPVSPLCRAYLPAEAEGQMLTLSAGGLRILQATYGGNCIEAGVMKKGTIAVCRGNVTEALGAIFNGMNEFSWQVEVEVLGDPAPEQAKDLEVYYSVLSDPAPNLHRVYIAAEAHGQILTLPAAG
jgi:hypothetical protein